MPEPTPIWQWAETNQGLLSLLALVLALSALVFETVRANRAAGAGRREYVVMILGLIEEALAYADAVVPTTGSGLLERHKVWNALRLRIVDVLEATRAAASPDAKLILLVAELSTFLFSSQWSVISESAGAAYFSSLGTELRRLREAFKERR